MHMSNYKIYFDEQFYWNVCATSIQHHIKSWFVNIFSSIWAQMIKTISWRARLFFTLRATSIQSGFLARHRFGVAAAAESIPIISLKVYSASHKPFRRTSMFSWSAIFIKFRRCCTHIPVSDNRTRLRLSSCSIETVRQNFIITPQTSLNSKFGRSFALQK